MSNRVSFLAAATALWLLAPAPARANVTFTFLENGSNTSLGASNGASVNFTESGFTLTATPYKNVDVNNSTLALNSVGTAATYSNFFDQGFKLYAKDDGAGEKGLGLTNDLSGNHEITDGSGILLDFSSLSMNKPYTISFNSVTGSDKFALYDAVTKALIGSGTSNTSVTIGTGNSDLKFLVTEVTPIGFLSVPNVLLGSVTITTQSPQSAPEPATLALALSGLGTLGLVGLRRRRKASAPA